MDQYGSNTGSPIFVTSNLDYLLQNLRLHLGDINPDAYRYTDTWLSTALVMSVKALGRWWRYKYLVDITNNVYRNSNNYYFSTEEPPIVEATDEMPIILMASIIVKGGDLENNAWNVGTWRDAEIYYSNVEAGKNKNESIERDRKELMNYVQPPTKRLAAPSKNSLPGYLNNDYERK